MKLRTIGGAVGAGIILAASIPAVAQAADPAPTYPTLPPKVTCSVKAVSNGGKIKVTMSPILPDGRVYTFRFDKRSGGQWNRNLKTYRTTSPGETLIVNLKKGKYRAKCYTTSFPLSSPGFDATSKSVKLKK